MYLGTSLHLNFLATAKPTVTAGLKCAPEISPKAYIIAITIKPQVMATPGWVIVPPVKSLITMAPQPQKIILKVPIISAM